jgi:hypothetical protein
VLQNHEQIIASAIISAGIRLDLAMKQFDNAAWPYDVSTSAIDYTKYTSHED